MITQEDVYYNLNTYTCSVCTYEFFFCRKWMELSNISYVYYK